MYKYNSVITLRAIYDNLLNSLYIQLDCCFYFNSVTFKLTPLLSNVSGNKTIYDFKLSRRLNAMCENRVVIRRFTDCYCLYHQPCWWRHRQFPKRSIKMPLWHGQSPKKTSLQRNKLLNPRWAFFCKEFVCDQKSDIGKICLDILRQAQCLSKDQWIIPSQREDDVISPWRSNLRVKCIVSPKKDTTNLCLRVY
jgi:hypothetical protein